MNQQIESAYTLVYERGVQSSYVETDKQLIGFVYKGYCVNVDAMSSRRVTFDKACQLAGQYYILGINCSLIPLTTLRDLMMESSEINRILAHFGKRIPGSSWALTKPKTPSETSGMTDTCVVWSKDNPAEIHEYPHGGTSPFICAIREEALDEL